MIAPLFALDAELEATALRLASVRDPRLLMLQVVALLIGNLRRSAPHAIGHASALERLLPLFEAASDACAANDVDALECVRNAADRLSSLLFACAGERGAWPLELRIPYDISNAIRRTCETNPRAMVSLVVRDARILLEQTAAPMADFNAVIEEAGQ
jgi:hypothetical protein